MALLTTTTVQDFNTKVLKSRKVVLVDFWAAWCPPCRAMAPTLEKLADKLDANLDVVKVNVEESAENNRLATENGVQSIPNMVVFKDGKEVDRIIGLTQEAVMTDQLKKHF